MRSSIESLLASVKIDDLPRRTVCRVDRATPLKEVYRLLDSEHSVAVLVADQNRLVGIFTERDILYRTALEGTLETPIGDLMTRELVTLKSDERVSDAIRTMAEKGFRHIPVVDSEGEEAGLIGGRDILRLLAEYYPETLLNLPPRLDQKITRAEGG
ncbi:MAG: CBS domain-containing protein [Thermoanaerobaculia bacterium]